jgi:hypothetical protein
VVHFREKGYRSFTLRLDYCRNKSIFKSHFLQKVSLGNGLSNTIFIYFQHRVYCIPLGYWVIYRNWIIERTNRQNPTIFGYVIYYYISILGHKNFLRKFWGLSTKP